MSGTGCGPWRKAALLALACALAAPAAFPQAESDRAIALVGGRVIDGTGAPPSGPATILIRGDRIASVDAGAAAPPGAEVVDVRGRTVIPGLVDMHGHLYARATREIRSQFEAYPLLYLAGGVTTVRTPGDLDPEGTIALRDRIRRGEAVGPRIFTAGPYFDQAPSEVSWIEGVAGPEEALRKLDAWKDRIDGIKLYTSAEENLFATLLPAARAAGLFTTAHLGSTTATRAIELGIGGLEHGIFAMPELPFDRNRERRRTCELADLDVDDPRVAELIDRIVSARVAIDPTVVVFQIMVPDFEPVVEGWERYLSEEARLVQAGQGGGGGDPAAYDCMRGALRAQLRFVGRLHERGGIVVAGTDPVAPVLVPGYGLHRELRNLVEAGLTPVAAIRAATLDAARALARGDDFGSIEAGKRADLVVVGGDPGERIEDIGLTEIVFQGGVRYDPAALRRQAEGRIR